MGRQPRDVRLGPKAAARQGVDGAAMAERPALDDHIDGRQTSSYNQDVAVGADPLKGAGCPPAMHLVRASVEWQRSPNGGIRPEVFRAQARRCGPRSKFHFPM